MEQTVKNKILREVSEDWRMRKRRKLARSGRWCHGGDRAILDALARRKKRHQKEREKETREENRETTQQQREASEENRKHRKKERHQHIQSIEEEIAEIEEQKEWAIATWTLDNKLRVWMSRFE